MLQTLEYKFASVKEKSMSEKNFLDSIRVQSPCSQSWSEMRGGDQIRFCSHCAKDVHNLSNFTRKEARRLVAESNGGICVQYVCRPDGRIQTLKKQLHQITRRTGIAAGVLGTSLTVSTLAYAQSETNSSKDLLEKSETVEVSKEKVSELKEAKTADVSGTITDPNGAVIPNASVTLSNEQTNETRTAASDDNGFYEFKDISAGTYKLKINALSFTTKEINNLDAENGNDVKTDVSLDLDGTVVSVAGGAMFIPYEQTLLTAVSDDNLEEAKNLISRGENVNAKDKNYGGITALFVAVENGNAEVAETLLNFGAKVNARDDDRQTPLMRLDDDASAEIVNLLIKHGAKVKLTDNEGNTVLHHLAGYDNAEVFQILIKEGADVDAQNAEGETALTISAENGNLENVKILLASGANVNARNKKGETALTLAGENENKEIVEILVAYGAAK